MALKDITNGIPALARELLSIPFERVWSSYDKEADVLYLTFKRPSHADDTELTDDDILICNYDGKELLVLTFDPGHYIGAFSRFRVKHLDNPLEKCFKPVNKINHFISAKGIKLGMTKEQLVQKLGSAYRQEIMQNNIYVLKYRGDINVDIKKENFQDFIYRKEHVVLTYFGEYYFKHNRLYEFSFGFE